MARSTQAVYCCIRLIQLVLSGNERDSRGGGRGATARTCSERQQQGVLRLQNQYRNVCVMINNVHKKNRHIVQICLPKEIPSCISLLDNRLAASCLEGNCLSIRIKSELPQEDVSLTIHDMRMTHHQVKTIINFTWLWVTPINCCLEIQRRRTAGYTGLGHPIGLLHFHKVCPIV